MVENLHLPTGTERPPVLMFSLYIIYIAGSMANDIYIYMFYVVFCEKPLVCKALNSSLICVSQPKAPFENMDLFVDSPNLQNICFYVVIKLAHSKKKISSS